MTPMSQSLRAPTPPIPKTIDDVWDLYRAYLANAEIKIQKNVASDVFGINQIAQYVLNSGGKRIRPLLLIISAHLCQNESNEDAIVLASVVEFIHTATLLHDDVIDEGEIRRGKQAARNLWGNHASILVGDFLYSAAMSLGLSLENQNQEINQILVHACMRMIEGEMLQHARNNDLNLSEADYLQIIERKTASLIAATCCLGGVVSHAPQAQRHSLREFGLNLGMAFQVADDTLDYVAQKSRLGKTLGKDLFEGKITLPLLHLMRRCNPDEHRQIRTILDAPRQAQDELDLVLELMNRYGSIQYAMQTATGFIQSAKDRLTVFADSPHKAALSLVADYIISRDH